MSWMRALHISAGEHYGGVEVMLLTLARCRPLCDLDHEFAICFGGRLSAELIAIGSPLHALGTARLRRPFSIYAARRRLRELLRRERFDVAICHMAWAHAIFGPAVRLARVPLVLWHHDPGDGRYWLDRWAKLNSPDLAICNSQFTADKLRRIYPEIPLQVLYCPVPMPEADGGEAARAALRDKLDTPADSVAIVQVGRMEEYKGHLRHLEALARLRDLPNWTCWQAGEPQWKSEARYLDRVKAAAARLGIANRIRFLGYWRDLAQLLRAADIYCQPNVGPEGFGITFIEALAARLPVVTTSLGPAAEIVDPSCGILVPPNDVGALAAALRRLIEDRALRTSMGGAGPARAKALCDPAHQMHRLATLLADAARSAPRRNIGDPRDAAAYIN
jgi:glycosyltransferase involved in cell wall biosynthesis